MADCPGSRSSKRHPRSEREVVITTTDDLAKLLAEHDDWLVVERDTRTHRIIAASMAQAETPP